MKDAKRKGTIIITAAIMFAVLFISCAGPQKKDDTLNRASKDMLKEYRGKVGVKIAIVKGNDIDKKAGEVGNDIINAVTKAVFEDGRFTIVERELLKKVLDEISLQQTGLVNGNAINRIGRLSGAQAVLVVRREKDQIDMRILSVENGEVLAFFITGTGREGAKGKTVEKTQYDTLKEEYLSMECPKQSRVQRETILASFGAYPEDKRIYYLMSMIQGCKASIEEERKNELFIQKKKELGLEHKSIKELETMFISRDSTQYPSKATRRMIIEQYRKSFLVEMPRQNPGMKNYYKELYAETLMKMIVE